MTHLLFAALLNTADAKKSMGEDNSTSTDNARPNRQPAKRQTFLLTKPVKICCDLTGNYWKGFSPNAMGLTYLTITFPLTTLRAEGLVQ